MEKRSRFCGTGIVFLCRIIDGGDFFVRQAGDLKVILLINDLVNALQAAEGGGERQADKVALLSEFSRAFRHSSSMVRVQVLFLSFGESPSEVAGRKERSPLVFGPAQRASRTAWTSADTEEVEAWISRDSGITSEAFSDRK